MTKHWRLERGATVSATIGSVHFSVWAPFARRVRVRITSAGGEHALSRSENGVFECTVPHARAGSDYGFLLDDREQLLPDPVSRFQPDGVHGPSRVVDPDAFRWSDHAWRGIAMADLVIYELHVGTFTDAGTFDAVIPHLRSLRGDLGVTAIEIMPVAQFPGTRNWGYDGVELYAVQNSYGGPEGLKRLVNAAHGVGLAVILDVVYNHVGPEGNYLPLYGPYFTEKYKTPWGPALNYDDADSDEVRRYVVDNALYWVTEYHIDGLRLDAVHGIFDFSATHLLQEIATAVHEEGERSERQVVVIAESDLNDPKLVRPTVHYGFGLDAQWSDDFHHAVHAALTGETAGYYADFGGADAVAASLREPFVYRGQFSTHRKRRHGGSSAGIPRSRFVVAVQNHDQVGNRASGDRLSAVLEHDQLRLAAALLLLSPYVPLLFMGQEYGETNPFQYFVSHGDPQLVDAVRTGRRREFESFGWGDEVPDPQAEETFRNCLLDRAKMSHPDHAAMIALYRDLLVLRANEPLLRPDGAEVQVEHADDCIVLLRAVHGDDGPALAAIFNCSAEKREVHLPNRGAGRWVLRLSTDAKIYGGHDRVPGAVGAAELAHAARASHDGWPGHGAVLRSAGAAADVPALEMPPWTAALFQHR